MVTLLDQIVEKMTNFDNSSLMFNFTMPIKYANVYRYPKKTPLFFIRSCDIKDITKMKFILKN